MSDRPKSSPQQAKNGKPKRLKIENPWAWVAAITIGVITWIAFSPSLSCDWTNWDDLDYVLNNNMVKSEVTQWKAIFTVPVSLNYHPLTMLSLAWNYQLGKLDPFGYHLVNVVFHLFNTLLVFLFFYRLTDKNLLIASVVSLFFGIHPMHVESVTWISERKDVLYVFFVLCGLVAYSRYKQTSLFLWYLISIMVFILACLSKGMAVVFPVLLVLTDYYRGVKINRVSIIEKVPFFLIGLLFGVFAFVIQQKGGVTVAMENFSSFQRIMFASYGLLLYVLKLFVPYNMANFHPYPLINKEDVLPIMFYFYPFIVLISVALIYRFFRSVKAVVFGLVFYFITVAMVLQFVSVGFAIVADRYTYLSYLGLLFVFASALDAAWKNKNRVLAELKYPLAVLTVAGVPVFSLITYERAFIWRDNEVLWTDEIKKYPQVDRSYWHRGMHYEDKKRYDEALRDYSKALEINPFYGAAYNSRAKLYFVVGDYDRSLADCYRAIKFDSLDKGTLINCGIIFRTLKKYEDAEKYFTKAYTIDPYNPGLFINRGILYDERNENEKALADFDKYLKLFQGRDDVAFNYRGVSFSKLERHPDAIADFTAAISINPSAPLYYTNRALSEYKVGNLFNARSDVMRAQELGAKLDSTILNTLGIR